MLLLSDRLEKLLACQAPVTLFDDELIESDELSAELQPLSA